MSAFMGAVIIILIVAPVVYFIGSATRTSDGLRRPKIINYSKTKIILSIYLAIVVVAIAVTYLTPNKYFYNEAPLSINEKTDFDNALNEFSQAAHNKEYDKFDKIKGFKMDQKLSFDFYGKELELSPDNTSRLNCVIERKNVNDNKIEIISYTHRTVLYGMDLSSKIQPFKIALNGSALGFNRPRLQRITINSFKKDFYITHFFKEDSADSNIFNLMETYIHIKIPKNVNIKVGDQLGYQIIQ